MEHLIVSLLLKEQQNACALQEERCEKLPCSCCHLRGRRCKKRNDVRSSPFLFHLGRPTCALLGTFATCLQVRLPLEGVGGGEEPAADAHDGGVVAHAVQAGAGGLPAGQVLLH
jgi:hypothetical protein